MKPNEEEFPIIYYGVLKKGLPVGLFENLADLHLASLYGLKFDEIIELEKRNNPKDKN